MEKKTNKDFTGIDIFKFCFSFAVIAIHTYTLSKDSGALAELAAWVILLGVPFFFIVSGFLVARKVETFSEEESARNFYRHRSLQLFRIFGCWLLIYLPITIYHTMSNHWTLWKSIGKYIVGVILRGESFYAWPLWFIYTMAIVFLIFSFIRTRKSKIAILIVFVAVYFIQWCYTNLHYSEFVYLFKLTHRTIGGGIYIAAGMLLYRYPALRRPLPTLVYFCLSILLFLSGLPLWELCGGAAFVNLAIMVQLPQNKTYLILRNLSMWIYFIHMYPVFIIYEACRLNDYHLGFIPMYITACICSLFLSIVLYTVSEKCPKASWLRNLIR